jgi:hypothetical protein
MALSTVNLFYCQVQDSRGCKSRLLFAKIDELAKSHKMPFSVIPAKAGIQYFQTVAEHLDSGFRRSDDFLRVHQVLVLIYFLNIYIAISKWQKTQTFSGEA